MVRMKLTQTERWIKATKGESILNPQEASETCCDKLNEVTKGMSTEDFLEVLALLSQEMEALVDSC